KDTGGIGSHSTYISNATDIGLGGITVKAFGSNGGELDSTTTSSSPGTLGNYDLDVSGATGEVRVQGYPPDEMVPGPNKANGGTTVEFVQPGATGVDVALTMPGEFAPQSPRLVYPLQRAAIVQVTNVANDFPNNSGTLSGIVVPDDVDTG